MLEWGTSRGVKSEVTNPLRSLHERDTMYARALKYIHAHTLKWRRRGSYSKLVVRVRGSVSGHLFAIRLLHNCALYS